MKEKYSEEWLELIHKREEYEKASFLYNKVNENQRRQDLRKALKESNVLEQWPVIKMMKEGYIYSDSIELVLDEVVEIATTGYEECVGGAVGALNHLSMKKWKNKIIQLVIFYTENNLKDKAVFHYSWHLLYRLGFKQALIDYVEKYEEYMEGELDEEDWKDIRNMTERCC
ncbi:MAG: hypothetical protein HDR20_10565 [Lachnospiraceae bacterium]|nr:hypothetical protein [Lachnospiraceae bacterium]